ncbi:hypothetical protein OG474_23835 [Kribbella sp. NBC_01505]|uniref:hypothetical protein n=1 Tax=Kribbella sp. NBC_01505 TaxID=2903580 RepID=UPI0038640107
MNQAEHIRWDDQLAVQGHVAFRAWRWGALTELLPVVVTSLILLNFWSSADFQRLRLILTFFSILSVVGLVSGIVGGFQVLTGRADLVVTPSGVGLAARTLAWNEIAAVTVVGSGIAKQVKITPHPSAHKRAIRIRHLSTPPAELAAWLEYLRQRSIASGS